jgi:teichuronic acid biosynthesis glycosyltransferase TuaG
MNQDHNQSPLVSIVMPAYNSEKWISEAITSVRSQDYENWELIVVDDGSSDLTFQKAFKLAENDIRIRVFQQANSGPAAARQAAIDFAKGRFIAFLDSDDLWPPNKLSSQISFMLEKSAVLSFTRFRRFRHNQESFGHLLKIPDETVYGKLLKSNVIATSTAIIDREKYPDIRIKKTYYDDYALWLDILRDGSVAHGLQMDLMRYRVVNNSVSRNKFKSAAMVWKLYRDVEYLNRFQSLFYMTYWTIRGLIKYYNF